MGTYEAADRCLCGGEGEKLAEKDEKLAEQGEKLAEQGEKLAEQGEMLAKKDAEIDRLKALLMQFSVNGSTI